MAISARQQVGHLWFVDPLAKALEVYRLAANRFDLVAEPFDAITLDLARWWGED